MTKPKKLIIIVGVRGLGQLLNVAVFLGSTPIAFIDIISLREATNLSQNLHIVNFSYNGWF